MTFYALPRPLQLYLLTACRSQFLAPCRTEIRAFSCWASLNDQNRNGRGGMTRYHLRRLHTTEKTFEKANLPCKLASDLRSVDTSSLEDKHEKPQKPRWQQEDVQSIFSKEPIDPTTTVAFDPSILSHDLEIELWQFNIPELGEDLPLENSYNNLKSYDERLGFFGVSRVIDLIKQTKEKQCRSTYLRRKDPLIEGEMPQDFDAFKLHPFSTSRHIETPPKPNFGPVSLPIDISRNLYKEPIEVCHRLLELGLSVSMTLQLGENFDVASRPGLHYKGKLAGKSAWFNKLQPAVFIDMLKRSPHLWPEVIMSAMPPGTMQITEPRLMAGGLSWVMIEPAAALERAVRKGAKRIPKYQMGLTLDRYLEKLANGDPEVIGIVDKQIRNDYLALMAGEALSPDLVDRLLEYPYISPPTPEVEPVRSTASLDTPFFIKETEPISTPQAPPSTDFSVRRIISMNSAEVYPGDLSPELDERLYAVSSKSSYQTAYQKRFEQAKVLLSHDRDREKAYRARMGLRIKARVEAAQSAPIADDSKKRVVRNPRQMRRLLWEEEEVEKAGARVPERHVVENLRYDADRAAKKTREVIKKRAKDPVDGSIIKAEHAAREKVESDWVWRDGARRNREAEQLEKAVEESALQEEKWKNAGPQKWSPMRKSALEERSVELREILIKELEGKQAFRFDKKKWKASVVQKGPRQEASAFKKKLFAAKYSRRARA